MSKFSIGKLLIAIPVVLYALVSLYPLLWVVFQSLKSEQQFLASIWTIPTDLHFENYVSAWENANFSTYYKNSLLVTSVTVGLGLLFTSIAGYAFARLQFVGKKSLFVLIVSVMLIPSPVFLLPVYFIARDMGILNTYIGLIGPYLAGLVPLGVILMSAYFREIPNDLSDAAKIDGCKEFGIYFRIMLPLTKPALATLGILFFMNIWNEYMWALISLSDTKLYTIPIGMATMESQKFVYGSTTVFAGIVISSIFVFLFFLFTQRFFMRAITEGAVKG